jgi:hypothetical protein
MAPGLDIKWYGERGIVNAIVANIQQSADPLACVRRLLSTIVWADASSPRWMNQISRCSIFVEWGWADFGNPDLLMLAHVPDGRRCVVIEAKVGPYLLSMMPNTVGMKQPGFNSSINGQLSLRYRFAKALERAASGALNVEESPALLEQYRQQLGDSRNMPRRLNKPEIVKNVLDKERLLGLPENRWSYVALTWDAEERVFFNDSIVREQHCLPCFLSDAGENMLEQMRGRLGWLGYQKLETTLNLRSDAEYVAAFCTMEANNQPDRDDYQLVEANVGRGVSPESFALAAKLCRELFRGYDHVQYTGSYSIKSSGQTIGKVIPGANTVFVGLRDTTEPTSWFTGPLQSVAVQGVTFLGVYVPVENPDVSEAVNLARGLATE